MGRKKRMVYDVPVVDVADRGKSVAKDGEGKVYFVDKAVPGDVVDILVLKKKKSFFQGIVKEYKKKSEYRVDPRCQPFGVCGGCKWQHLDYDAQLRFKSGTVLNAMTRIGKVDPSVILPIKGATEIFNYRNKLEYSFSSKRWLTDAEIQSEDKINQSPALGFHAPGAFDKVVDVNTCHLQEDLSNDIRNFVREYTKEHDLEYYDARAHTGLMRNMILRNTSLDQWMLIMSFAHEDDAVIPLMNTLKEKFPRITSLHYVINKKHNDTILDQNIILHSGTPYIVEKLGNVKYKIGPKSFFQTNTTQAKTLFDVVVEFADLKEINQDLVGNITEFLSKFPDNFMRTPKKKAGNMRQRG